MKTKISIKNKSYNIEISKIKENLLKVKVEGEEYFFSRDESGELTLLEKQDFPIIDTLEKSEVVPNFPQEKEIKTQLAGIVSKVHIRKEETVKPGKTVVTLIAMKMENEIISEGYGRVKEIKVKEKQFVNSGDTLIVLE